VILAVECNKTIEVSSARDHDQELYCKTCHSRLFGPKGYGFAGGAGSMLSMDTGKCGDIPTEYAAQLIVFAPCLQKDLRIFICCLMH